MKKQISLRLIIGLLLSLSLTLVACEEKQHTHIYQTEWMTDEESHWHACAGDEADRGCDDVSDKAEHQWDEGVVLVEPTAEEEGSMTFTCTVCQATKSEPIPFDGMSEAEWLALSDLTLYSKYSTKTTQTDRYFKTVAETRVVDGYVYQRASFYDLTTNEYEGGNKWGKASLEQVTTESLLPDFLEYSKIVYIADRNVYRYTEDYTTVIGGDLEVTYTDMEWTVTDGKLEKYECTFYYEDEVDGKVVAKQTHEFYDYGATVAPEGV